MNTCKLTVRQKTLDTLRTIGNDVSPHEKQSNYLVSLCIVQGAFFRPYLCEFSTSVGGSMPGWLELPPALS